ncbi:MAG: hypothetical protein LBU88_06005 [Treponema sp.]|jgi:tetratricopeptide (TPR) repeat protein|nr:hypothetical protein [Treponema sp.]
MKKSLFVLIIVFLITAMFPSCKTLSDISINSQRGQLEENIAKVEAAIVPFEAASISGVRPSQADITGARQIITDMEKEAAADADYSAKLTAWLGRLELLAGRYSEAQRLHRQSNTVSSGNVPAIVLGIRMEGDPAKRLEIIDRELMAAGVHAVGAGELNIERARTLLDLSRFSEAAGAFDIAFASKINPVYRESYSTYRARAWELRNATGIAVGTFGFLIQDTLSWNDCITIIKNETQLLRFMTGGRNVTEADLFNRLLDRAFIPFTQDITITNWPMTKPNITETVTRAGAAYLIWHLFAEARADRGMLSRYSARYARGTDPRSPIADVPVLSPYFDAILGCVEREFLSLPDGRNFRPAQPIRGAELLTILKKIEG